MLYIRAGLIAAILILSQALHGGTPENSGTGIIHYGRERLESVKENGRVTLKGTHVNQAVEVNGSLWAHKATLGSIEVGGHAYVSNSTILGPTKVNGFFSAENSNFKNKVTVAAQKITFKNCKVQSIFVKKSYWPFARQVVEFTKKSRCPGSIVFESGKGRVIVRDKSEIKKYKVKGAKVEQH